MLPYTDYYRSRNGLVAKLIAECLDVGYLGDHSELPPDERENTYLVPPVTQIRGKTILKSNVTERDFYGALVSDEGHVHKAILHPTNSRTVPLFHSHKFAFAVTSFVLPGFAPFSVEDAKKAFVKLKVEGLKNIRVKTSNKSDGVGQYSVKSEEELARILLDFDQAEIVNNGIVLEPDLADNKTISLGFCILGEDTFSFIAQQKNDIAPEDGRDRYAGALVRVVRGDMNNLMKFAASDNERDAVRITEGFYGAYSHFKPIASRLSFDVIFGENNGSQYRGVTDITARLGGTCPALLLAAHEHNKDPGLRMVESEVTLNYDTTEHLESEQGATRFIDLPSLRLSARINKLHK